MFFLLYYSFFDLYIVFTTGWWLTFDYFPYFSSGVETTTNQLCFLPLRSFKDSKGEGWISLPPLLQCCFPDLSIET